MQLYSMQDVLHVDGDVVGSISPSLGLAQLSSLLAKQIEHQIQSNSNNRIVNNSNMHSSSSTFLFHDTSYFFSYSEVIDYHLGKRSKHSLQACLNLLEQHTITVPHVMALFASLFKQQGALILVDDLKIAQLVNNDGVKLLIACLSWQLQKMQEKDGDILANEMSFKIVMNILYICCDYLERNPTHLNSSQQLNQLYIDTNVDDLLMKMVTLSLEVHFIPVKKLAMLYTKVLSNLFHHGNNPPPNINPISIYCFQEIAQFPQNNLLRAGQLDKLKAKTPPQNLQNSKQRISSIQAYYRKHNTGECPLAQSIVVGLLRSLLTICNCQIHKKFSTAKGAGVDSFREWQLSYRWILTNPELLGQLPVSVAERVSAYQKFDQQPSMESETWSQFYSHKIYTAAAITSFFFLLLAAFKHNQFLQFSYFLQLISDANGILVFLKFLTDKFTSLDSITQQPVFVRDPAADPSFGFKEKTMLTIHSVLLMLHASCNNYPQKIRNYLFNLTQLIIKKIPGLFMKKEDRLRISIGKEEDPAESGGSNSLPSRKELEDLQAEKGGRGVTILKHLTELCFDMLKIQIPFFSKKMKENSANMRLIIDIYCKFPKQIPPIVMSSLEKLALKNKCGMGKQQKYITSVEEMKAVHNEYNNIYYWSNDFLHQKAPRSVRLMESLEPLGDPTAWLEENIWKYYDESV